MIGHARRHDIPLERREAWAGDQARPHPNSGSELSPRGCEPTTWLPITAEENRE